MPNTYVTLEGELNWVRHIEPELSPFTEKGKPPRYNWKVMIRPNAESLTKVLDMLSKGVKNKLSKDDQDRYYVNFSRPTEIRGKKGVTALNPPVVTMKDGTVITESIVAKPSKGSIKVELYQHAVPNGGKAFAARWVSATIDEFVELEAKSSEKPQGWGG